MYLETITTLVGTHKKLLRIEISLFNSVKYVFSVWGVLSSHSLRVSVRGMLPAIIKN